MVSQVWEGVSRMTALAKQTTQAFLEGSVVLGQVPPGIQSTPGPNRTTVPAMTHIESLFGQGFLLIRAEPRGGWRCLLGVVPMQAALSKRRLRGRS